MTDAPTSQPAVNATDAAARADSAPEKGKKKKDDNFFVFLLKLAAIVLIFRSFIFAPFSIPSESMLPRLLEGDYLLASKWSYGFSNSSLPFGITPLPNGRIFASQPERGDIVIVKAPPLNNQDYIKRVIGVPGDEVQMIDGILFLNGMAVNKERIADFVVPVSPNTECAEVRFVTTLKNGKPACRYPQYRETLPNGVSYNVLDFDLRPQDNTPPVRVPEGMLFLMGDNRDNSLDSRFPPVPNAGIGMVPQDNLVAKATVMMWSTDGSAEWYKPWTWFTAARWDRIGGTF